MLEDVVKNPVDLARESVIWLIIPIFSTPSLDLTVILSIYHISLDYISNMFLP